MNSRISGPKRILRLTQSNPTCCSHPPAKHGNANIPRLSWKKTESGEGWTGWLYAEKFDPKRAHPEQRPRPDAVLCSRCGRSERLKISPVSASSAFTYLSFPISYPVVCLVSRQEAEAQSPPSCLQDMPSTSLDRVGAGKGQDRWGGCAWFIILSGP